MNVPERIYVILEILKSTLYKGDIKRRHFAVVIRRGKMITPIAYNYHRMNVFGKTRGTMHAEMTATNYLVNTDKSIQNKHKELLLMYKTQQHKMRKTDMLVVRYSTLGIRYSKPCSECIQTMKRLKYRRVYYSLDNGTLVCEKVSHIQSEHQTQMSRYLHASNF